MRRNDVNLHANQRKENNDQRIENCTAGSKNIFILMQRQKRTHLNDSYLFDQKNTPNTFFRTVQMLHIYGNVVIEPFVKDWGDIGDPDYLLDCVLEGRGIRCPPFLRDLRT